MRWVWLVGLAACWSNAAPEPPAQDPVIGELAIANGPEVRVVAVTAHGLAVTRRVVAPEIVTRLAWAGRTPVALLARSHAVGEITDRGFVPLRPVDDSVWMCDGDRESPLTGRRSILPRPATAQTFGDLEGTFVSTWDMFRGATGAVWLYSCTRGGFGAECFEGCGHYARIAPRPFAVTEEPPPHAPRFELPTIASAAHVCPKHAGDPVPLDARLTALDGVVYDGCAPTELRYAVGPHGHVAIYDREQLRVLIRGREIGAIRGGTVVELR